MHTATFVHLAAACGLLVVSFMPRVGFGQDYTVRPFEAAQPTAWYPEPLKELGLHWTSFVAESLCKNYLILGAHEPGELDRCEYIVYDLVNNAVVNRVPIEAPAEYLDFRSRLDPIVAVEQEGAPVIWFFRFMRPREASPHAQRLLRRLGSERMLALQESDIVIGELQTKEKKISWEATSTVVQRHEEMTYLVMHGYYGLGRDDYGNTRCMLPSITIRVGDVDHGRQSLSSAQYVIVGSPIQYNRQKGLQPAHGVLSLASRRAAGTTRNLPSGLGVVSRNLREVQIFDVDSGEHLHSYILKGRRDFRVQDIHSPVVMGAAPCGQYATFSVSDAMSHSSSGDGTAKEHVQYAILLVRLTSPWAMELVLTPLEPQRMLWSADGHAYLVVSQPFLGEDVRPGGMEQPPVYRVSLEFMNR